MKTITSSVLSLIQNKAPQYVGRTSGTSSALLGNGPGRPGIEAQMRTMGSVSTVFAIVDAISDSMAEADWALYPIGSDEPETAHPAALLWETPNPFMDQDTFVKTAMQHYDLAGETTWNVSRTSLVRTGGQRVSDMPLELWPVLPDYLTPVPHKDKFLEGWVYQVPGGEAEPWTTKDLIQMKRPSPFDPYRGIAPIASAMIDVFGAKAASEYAAAWYRNGATPGGIIQFPERLPDDAYDEFVDRWRAQHQGTMNANRVAVLEGATWTSITQSMRDQQFEELSKLNREFIREAYRFPRALLGYADDVNKASARAGIEIFVTLCIRPRLNALQAVLNTVLLPMFGAAAKGYEFRFTNPVVADKEMELLELTSKSTAAKTLVEAGFEAKAVLKAVGLPDMAFEKPAATAPAAPGGDSAPARVTEPVENEIPLDDIVGARRGRPSLANDPDARRMWDQMQDYWREFPNAPDETVGDHLGVSRWTVARYRSAFKK
jgi:HK97 family phage portal protein